MNNNEHDLWEAIYIFSEFIIEKMIERSEQWNERLFSIYKGVPEWIAYYSSCSDWCVVL